MQSHLTIGGISISQMVTKGSIYGRQANCFGRKSKNQGIDWPSVQPDFEAKVGMAGFEPATT